MSRGFIKPVGGNMRMRMVQSGYSADDFSTPPNKVIFDSEDIGTLSVVASGVQRLNRLGPLPQTTKIATWNLPYVPLCTFQFRTPGISYWLSAIGIIPIASPYQTITVDTTGITITLAFDTEYVDIRYQAYRLVVA